MKLAPRTIDFVDTAPFKIDVERSIDATPAEVFDVIADTPGFPDWVPAINAAEWTSDAPANVNSDQILELVRLVIAASPEA